MDLASPIFYVVVERFYDKTILLSNFLYYEMIINSLRIGTISHRTVLIQPILSIPLGISTYSRKVVKIIKRKKGADVIGPMLF